MTIMIALIVLELLFDKSWSFKINYKGADIQDGNGFKVGGWGKSATARDKYGKYSGEDPPSAYS